MLIKALTWNCHPTHSLLDKASHRAKSKSLEYKALRECGEGICQWADNAIDFIMLALPLNGLSMFDKLVQPQLFSSGEIIVFTSQGEG